MYTPWGRSQSTTRIAPGLCWVSTAGHGGLMVSWSFAKRHLSPEAQAQGNPWASYLAYEEDCAYAIPCWELLDAFPNVLPTRGRPPTEVREGLLRTISRWTPSYLLARGITPSEPEYAQHLKNQEADRLRAERSPDLITTAYGDWHAAVPKGSVGVLTADGRFHLVTDESYVRSDHRLSACTPFRPPADDRGLTA